MADPQLATPIENRDIHFTIVLPPKGQARSRHRKVTTKAGNSFDMAYKTKDQATDEAKLAALLAEHRPPIPLVGPITLVMHIFLPIPKGKSSKWKDKAHFGIIVPLKKPDLSNVIKHIEDMMKGVFFEDDAQIVDIFASKHWGLPARYEIVIKYRKDMQPNPGNYERLEGKGAQE